MDRNRDITFNFDKLKYNKNVRKIYKSEIFKFINRNKDNVFTILDEYGDATHNTFNHIETFFIKNSIKSGYINRSKGILYIETMNKQKYIAINKRLKI